MNFVKKNILPSLVNRKEIITYDDNAHPYAVQFTKYL